MTIQIDAHHHYWNPARGDYGWMPADHEILSRPYGPADLSPMLERHEIDRTIVVQAAPSVEETEYLLGIADATPSVAGVVGWINFEDPGNLDHLQRLAQHPKFKGVRPMIQDIADPDWMLRQDVQWGYEALITLNLSFDALGFPLHLDNFLTLLTRYPDMRAVIDHCMKPQIRDRDIDRWATGMTRLAKETGACCKLSGLVTEAADGWTTDDLKPYADHVVETFGPDRVMWGSDWPVCRLQASYDQWRKTSQTLTDHLNDREIARIFGGTATEFYKLDIR